MDLQCSIRALTPQMIADEIQLDSDYESFDQADRLSTRRDTEAFAPVQCYSAKLGKRRTRSPSHNDRQYFLVGERK